MGGVLWTESDDAELLRAYPDESTAAVARRLGRSVTAVYGRAWKLGVGKSEVYLASPDACRLRRGDNVGAASRFRPGHVPANKGLRRPGWGPGRMKETQFQPGHGGIPGRVKPIGATRLVGGYLYRNPSDAALRPVRGPTETINKDTTMMTTLTTERPRLALAEDDLARYVVGFCFNTARTHVVLIRKERPQWKAGKWNGIGGHVEAGETPAAAMRREWREETGSHVDMWDHFLSLYFVNDDREVGVCWFYRAVGDPEIHQATDEEVSWMHVRFASGDIEEMVSNLRWLIPLAQGQELLEPIIVREASRVGV